MTEKAAYSVETFVRIHDDKSGDYIQVGPDRDGIGNVEITTSDGEAIVMPAVLARLVSHELLVVAQRIEASETPTGPVPR